MLSHYFSLLALTLVGVAATPVARGNPSFPYGSSKVRGVNLGGWLVLEPWITPSLFERTGNPAIVDEWTFGQYQDKSAAQAALRHHWDTWITESDFAQIAAAGLNHVRIPIGFWAFDVSGGEPYVQGQADYLRKAADWANNHGLKVIIDLHGVPGSQNGFDNSGQRMDFPQWQSSGSNFERSKSAIKSLANMFKDQTHVVTIIEALNEPAAYRDPSILDTAKQFYRDSYGSIRYPYGNDRQSNLGLMIHDAFQPVSSWNGFMPASEYQAVSLDTHIYQVFSDDENAMSQDQHISTACSQQSALASSNNNYWTIVGEWSPAITDCAKYLNGRGRGARYDGSYAGSRGVGSCQGYTSNGAAFSADYKRFLRKFWEAQTIAYEKGSGWIMWTWKAEDADEWSYQAGLKYGWIPYNPTNRIYPTICG